MASWLTNNTGLPFFSRKWDPETEIPDLTGTVAIVTGGNTGLGFITTLKLLQHGAKVYIACRSEERANDAISRLSKEVPDAASKVVFLPFDLTDIGSAEKAAAQIRATENRLDTVIANAGIMAWPYKIENGLEVQLWNHLGHMALIQALLPLMKDTAKQPGARVRIVNVSSLGHNFTPRPDFTSLETANRPLMNTWARYGQSKLANILYNNALQRRVDKDNIRCIALHPGNVHTELLRGVMGSYGFLGKIAFFLSSKLGMTPYDGAKTQIYAATSPEVDEKDLKGAYLMPIATVETPSKYARDEKLQEELWQWSEQALKDLRSQAPTQN